MFDKITQFMDEKLSTPMARLAEQRHLRAIRDGIIATLPIIIVASMFLVIAFLPDSLPQDWAITSFLRENQTKILLPHRVSMYIMTLYAVFGIGHSLAQSYDLDGLSGGILSELAFLLTITPKMIPAATEGITKLAGQNPELQEFVNGLPVGFVMPMPNLGSAGMFIGILASFFAVEVYRFTQKSGFKISMPPQVPASVARSFEALTPTTIVLLVLATITYFLEIDLHSIVGTIVAPLIKATDSLPSVLIIVILSQFFWSFGIHGWSIVGSLARPLWLILLDQNTLANSNHEVITNIAAEPFYQWFVNIGGSGATLGLAILFTFFSRSAYGKSLGKTAVVPSIFNINEPMIFGAPIVLNPMLIIPFIAVPVINALITWFAISFGWVNKVVALAPWTLPGPIGAFIATGSDLRAAILSILLILLSIVLYYPFFRMYDKKLLEEETADLVEEVKASDL
ncbi:PTS sugar transporter subunit IIC [Vaginisenegalia massiliensis]|uniref:PTS sugar transporter subunit IIC n=1 Tax=Vaginisenegalia massiliensis TaxID=2058294 RepID=UPI000F533CAC|nr:PTS sugar transporter subunit IIC [Vaginisenegalia massiliensis]